MQALKYIFCFQIITRPVCFTKIVLVNSSEFRVVVKNISSQHWNWIIWPLEQKSRLSFFGDIVKVEGLWWVSSTRNSWFPQLGPLFIFFPYYLLYLKLYSIWWFFKILQQYLQYIKVHFEKSSNSIAKNLREKLGM